MTSEAGPIGEKGFDGTLRTRRRALLDLVERVTDGPRGRDQVALFWGRRRRLGDRAIASFYYTISARRWAARGEDPAHVVSLQVGLERCPEPQHVLDLGTGAGAGATVIARRFPDASVAAVDHNRRMLQTAKAWNNLPNIQYQRSRHRGLPFDDASFDLICALNVAPELSEVRRVVAPEGRILIASTFFAEAYEGWVRRWEEMGFELEASEPAGEHGHWELYRPSTPAKHTT